MEIRTDRTIFHLDKNDPESVWALRTSWKETEQDLCFLAGPPATAAGANCSRTGDGNITSPLPMKFRNWSFTTGRGSAPWRQPIPTRCA